MLFKVPVKQTNNYKNLIINVIVLTYSCDYHGNKIK